MRIPHPFVCYTESMNPLNHFEHIVCVDSPVDLMHQLDTDRTLANQLTPTTLIIRGWPTRGVILGKLDTVLPGFEDGLAFLNQQNLPVLIRKAGGLGVVCDEGVLNLTFLLSKHQPIYGGLHASYTLAVELIRLFLAKYRLTIDVKAIPQSYCPGDYDLSVKGQKIAGIAQFRTKDTVMVMATLAVGGNQRDRCTILHEFYARANRDHDPAYPAIDPSFMTTISDLVGSDVRVNDVWEHITAMINSRE
jgi:octanoyl-[GcvH]:protein N-octanoyltransferase